MFMAKVYLCVLVIGCLALVGCGKKTKKGEAANASFQFANSTSLLLDADCPDLGDGPVAECLTPTTYGIKILNVIISPDEKGALSGPAGLIWVNKDCNVETRASEINEKEYEYHSASSCKDVDVDSYFELARSTEKVNKELNSQQYKILPGTYNYVQLTLCMDGPESKSGHFQTEGMSEPYEFVWGTCGISSAKANPPIVVGEGESITVSLAYDLTNSAYTSNADANTDYCYVSDDKTISRCVTFPKNLTPSFEKAN
jgi:hypothetical protein